MPKCKFANDWFAVAVLIACVLVTGQVSAADVNAILEQASKTYATFDTVKYRADCRCRVVGQPSKSVIRIRLQRHFDLLDIKSLSFHNEKDETSVRFNRTTFGRRFGVSYQTSGHLNEHRAQVHNYLKASGYRLGIIANFGQYPKLQYERIVR